MSDETFISLVFQKIQRTLTKICLQRNQKAYFAILLNVLSMLKDFSRSQAVTYAEKVVIYMGNDAR